MLIALIYRLEVWGGWMWKVQMKNCRHFADSTTNTYTWSTHTSSSWIFSRYQHVHSGQRVEMIMKMWGKLVKNIFIFHTREKKRKENSWKSDSLTIVRQACPISLVCAIESFTPFSFCQVGCLLLIRRFEWKLLNLSSSAYQWKFYNIFRRFLQTRSRICDKKN